MTDIDALELFKDYSDSIKERYGLAEPSMFMNLDETKGGCMAMSSEDSRNILNSLTACPNGPLEHDGHGIKTSSNIGIISSDDDTLKITVKPRSSDDDALEKLISKISATFGNASVNYDDPFPSWLERDGSPIVLTTASVYRKVMGRNPRITTVHGGLETSVIKAKHPGMSAISIGPTIIGAHTPEERMDISTLSEMRRLVTELVKTLSRERSDQRQSAFDPDVLQTDAVEESILSDLRGTEDFCLRQTLAFVKGLRIYAFHSPRDSDGRYRGLPEAPRTDRPYPQGPASSTDPVRNANIARTGI
jgi:hypothetical protein